MDHVKWDDWIPVLLALPVLFIAGAIIYDLIIAPIAPLFKSKPNIFAQHGKSKTDHWSHPLDFL